MDLNMKLKNIMITSTIAIGLMACTDKDASTVPSETLTNTP